MYHLLEPDLTRLVTARQRGELAHDIHVSQAIREARRNRRERRRRHRRWRDDMRT
jgi:hypothetical protein